MHGSRYSSAAIVDGTLDPSESIASASNDARPVESSLVRGRNQSRSSAMQILCHMPNDSSTTCVTLRCLLELHCRARSSLPVSEHVHRTEKLSVLHLLPPLAPSNRTVRLHHELDQGSSLLDRSGQRTARLQIVFYINDRTWLESLLPSIPSYAILIIAGPGALYTCNLLGYHCMISTRALTTREDDKGIYLHDNPFDRRRWYLNLARRLCTSLPPSACKIDDGARRAHSFSS